MKYFIDERGIHYLVEDAEADQVAALKAEPIIVDEPAEIPLSDAIAACHKISAELNAALGNGDAVR